MNEKKEIKMSLWSFWVLIAGIVILISAIIISGFIIINKGKNNQINESDKNTEIVTDAINGTNNSNTNTNKTDVNSNIISNETIITQVNETTNNVTNSQIGTSNKIENSNTTVSFDPTASTKNNSVNSDAKNYILYTNGTNGRLDSNDLNYNTVLSSKINIFKNVNNVSNYASTMKWYVYDNLDYSIPYPSDWKIEWPTNGIEQIKISGTVEGKQAIGNGENGDKVVETEMMFIVYKPVICTSEEINKMDLKNTITYENETVNWVQATLEGNNVIAEDNYGFVDNKDGTYKLVRVRILNAKGEDETYKTLNIENYFLEEIKVK